MLYSPAIDDEELRRRRQRGFLRIAGPNFSLEQKGDVRTLRRGDNITTYQAPPLPETARLATPRPNIAVPQVETMPQVEAAKNRMNEFAGRTEATQTAYGLRNVDPALLAAQRRADMGLGSVEARRRRVEETYWRPRREREAQESELARTRAQFAEPAEIQGRYQKDIAGVQGKTARDIAGIEAGPKFFEAGAKERLGMVQAERELEGKREETRAKEAALQQAGITAEQERVNKIELRKLENEGWVQRQREANLAYSADEKKELSQLLLNATKLRGVLGSEKLDDAQAEQAQLELKATVARINQIRGGQGEAGGIPEAPAPQKQPGWLRFGEGLGRGLRGGAATAIAPVAKAATTLRQALPKATIRDAQEPALGGSYPEGTIIKNSQGVRMIKRNGKWQNLQ